jgi:hypothetical protein
MKLKFQKLIFKTNWNYAGSRNVKSGSWTSLLLNCSKATQKGCAIMPDLGVEPRSPGELQRNSTTEQQFNFNIKHAPGKKTCSLQLTEELDKGQTFHQVKQRCKKNGLLWDLNSGLLNWNMHLATGLHEHDRFHWET